MKVLDQTQREASTRDSLLHCLLSDALTGNSKTTLIYCVLPQGKCSAESADINLTRILSAYRWLPYPSGVLDDETHSALALAQKARSLVTIATSNRWCPRATEQEIRDNIAEIRTRMMTQEEDEVHDTYRLAELTQNLQVIQKMSLILNRTSSSPCVEGLIEFTADLSDRLWRISRGRKGGKSRRRQEAKCRFLPELFTYPLSNVITDNERCVFPPRFALIWQSCPIPNSNWHSSDHRESTDTIKYLQEQLKQEMQEHIRGKTWA